MYLKIELEKYLEHQKKIQILVFEYLNMTGEVYSNTHSQTDRRASKLYSTRAVRCVLGHLTVRARIVVFS